jgi:hypothetical protein
MVGLRGGDAWRVVLSVDRLALDAFARRQSGQSRENAPLEDARHEQGDDQHPNEEAPVNSQRLDGHPLLLRFHLRPHVTTACDFIQDDLRFPLHRRTVSRPRGLLQLLHRLTRSPPLPQGLSMLLALNDRSCASCEKRGLVSLQGRRKSHVESHIGAGDGARERALQRDRLFCLLLLDARQPLSCRTLFRHGSSEGLLGQFLLQPALPKDPL